MPRKIRPGDLLTCDVIFDQEPEKCIIIVKRFLIFDETRFLGVLAGTSENVCCRVEDVFKIYCSLLENRI
jgi:hypothetical protein